MCIRDRLDLITITAQFKESIAEALNVAETEAIVAQFAESIAENISVLDSYTAGLVIFFSITENSGIANTQLIQTGFAENIAENINLADQNSIQAAFLESIAENIGVLDNNCVFGWFKINDNQNPQWGGVSVVIEEIAVFGGSTFGGIDFAGSMKSTRNESLPVGLTPAVVWSDVNTNESSNWAVVDNTQKC